MTLGARVTHLYQALDRSGRAYATLASDTSKPLNMRVRARAHSGVYALVTAFLMSTAALKAEEVEGSLNNILAVCSEYAGRELPDEPEREEGIVEDTEKAAARWYAQGQVATYRQVKLQIEHVLDEHRKALEKHAHKAH